MMLACILYIGGDYLLKLNCDRDPVYSSCLMMDARKIESYRNDMRVLAWHEVKKGVFCLLAEEI